MKIKKIKTLLESAEPEIKDGEEVLDDLNVEKVEGELELDKASEDKILADLASGAVDANVQIDVEEAEKEAEFVSQIAKTIENPYGTAQPQFVKRVLQKALKAALRQKKYGLNKNFPNVLIYGLAGFGKTSIVKEFCAEHNIYLFECDAKSLDIATVGGIPYPKQNPKTGEYVQAPIASSYWNSLDDNGHEHTIIFLDEINRTSGKLRGSLLDLINEHRLPTFIEDPKTGKTKTTKTFNNILFSVVAINPADDIFPDCEPLDPAVVSRHGFVIGQNADKKEFYNVLDRLYKAILSLNLSPEDRAVYEGQRNLMKAILTHSKFKFDDAEMVRSKFDDSQEKGIQYNYLNYRSFTLLLEVCDGTKDDFLWSVENASGYGDEVINMFKIILANYQDKVTTGNNVFNKTQVDPAQFNKHAAEAAKLIDDFINTLDD